jgi:hypothetical protein
MCPVCLATAALIAGSASGTGGLTALVVSMFRRKSHSKFPTNIEPHIKQEKENRDGHNPDRSSSAPHGFA